MEGELVRVRRTAAASASVVRDAVSTVARLTRDSLHELQQV